MPIKFEHRRSTRRQGVYELLSLAAVVIVLAVVYRLFLHPRVWGFSFYGFIAVMGTLALALAVHAVWEIVRNGEFTCRIDDEIIECVSPNQASGNSFRLQIADIAKIEKTTQCDSAWWYLWDKDGNRYWLTSNFGNPVHKFLNAIEEINPAVVEVESMAVAVENRVK